jgi:thiol-disulfide isomerase/thioredoxin
MKQALLGGFLGAVFFLGLSTFIPRTASVDAAQKLNAEEFQKAKDIYKEAYSHLISKQYAKSNQLFEQLLKLLPERANSKLDADRNRILYNMACNHAMLGEKSQALTRLEEAVERGFWNHEFLAQDPTLQAIRGEAKYKQVLEKSRQGLGSMAIGLKDLNGKELKREDLKDKVLVLDVWGTWCGWCVKEIPHLIKLEEKYGKDGLAIIGLTWENGAADETIKQRVKAFAKQQNINYTLVFMEPSLLAAINISGFPTTFFVGRDGVVRKRVSGYNDYGDLEEIVKPLLNEKPGK